LDAGDGMVILEYRAAVTDGTWRLKGIFQGRLNKLDEAISQTGRRRHLGWTVVNWQKSAQAGKEDATRKALLVSGSACRARSNGLYRWDADVPPSPALEMGACAIWPYVLLEKRLHHSMASDVTIVSSLCPTKVP
ncbi:hypothetical protein, partial [Xanthomonas fragariae]